MRLHKLKIEGFRRIKKGEVFFGDATFLIGPNNSGKSSVLRALDILLSAQSSIPIQEYYSETDAETKKTKAVATSIVLEAEFRNLPKESKTWRGFKGRVFDYPVDAGSAESGLAIHYRKTFPSGGDVEFSIRSLKRALKPAFAECKKARDFIDAGADAAQVSELFANLDKAISAGEKSRLDALDEIWAISNEETWFNNPGGIPGIVISRLPRFLLIPAETSAYQIHEGKGVLPATLNELFKDVRGTSENYKKAQEYLDKLAKELDPADEQSEFGKMMNELNQILAGVFPDSKIHALADLSDPNKALVPTFDVEMSSNVRTKVVQQGTGMVRAAVFGLLRFRQKWLARRDKQEDRSLIIGFEEPEIYLHPSAANQMRNTIYELSTSSSQIVATTHSPFTIDLSRQPRQVLNRFRADNADVDILAFSVSDKFRQLEADERDHVKMVLRIDDHVARSFFTKHVVVVEGDTEQVVIREALARLPLESQLRIRADFELIKARGKAAIIGLARYFAALGLDIHVMHDRDQGIAGAEKFNGPIAAAVGNPAKLTVLEECIEDVLGYHSPTHEKPFEAHKFMSSIGPDWNDVPERLRAALGRVFAGYLP